MQNDIQKLNEVCNGWTESQPGALLCNPNIAGGIIDSEILSGKWFVIFNDSRKALDGFATRTEAVAAFISAKQPEETAPASLYLVEYYTKHPGTGETGWEIRFAWIGANQSSEARQKAKALPFFDEIILCDQQAEIVKLAGVDAATVKHIDDDKWRKTKSGVWADISEKVYHYKTAKLGNNYVAIVGVVAPGTLAIRHSSRGVISAECHTLTNYCL